METDRPVITMIICITIVVLATVGDPDIIDWFAGIPHATCYEASND